MVALAVVIVGVSEGRAEARWLRLAEAEVVTGRPVWCEDVIHDSNELCVWHGKLQAARIWLADY